MRLLVVNLYSTLIVEQKYLFVNRFSKVFYKFVRLYKTIAAKLCILTTKGIEADIIRPQIVQKPEFRSEIAGDQWSPLHKITQYSQFVGDAFGGLY